MECLWLDFEMLIFSCVYTQLPMYEPSKEESEDPALYAKNVRHYMVSFCLIEVSSFLLETLSKYSYFLA